MQAKNQQIDQQKRGKLGWPSWSKAVDLSSIIFGCVGSNPTPSKLFIADIA